MNWQRIEHELEAAFQPPKLELTEGRVLRAGEPLKLGKLVSSAVETEDEEAELESEGMGDVLAKRWRLAALLEFEWESLGPMSWFADLAILDVGLPRVFIYTYQEALAEVGEDPWLVLAAIEPADSPRVFSAFFRDLVKDDGHGYGLEGFFGGLPSNTRNHQPDLVPADVIQESYWSWMEWASRSERDSWTDLRDRVLRKATDPRVLRPFGETLKEALRNQEHEALRQEEAAALTEKDRRRILEIYFSQAYRER